MLGDCDGDGRIGEGEMLTALPRTLVDVAYDFSLIYKDGSRGLHNPGFTFGLLRQLETALGR